MNPKRLLMLAIGALLLLLGWVFRPVGLFIVVLGAFLILAALMSTASARTFPCRKCGRPQKADAAEGTCAGCGEAWVVQARV